MLEEKQIESYLREMENKLVKHKKRKKTELSNDWANGFPDEPGVYVAFENGDVVYVGETGNIRARMKDLLDSRHHSLRRNIGRLHFSKTLDYKDANTKEKFPQTIEEKLERWIEEKIRIFELPVKLGRKELEERIYRNHKPIYNKKGQRKTG
jgi:hypothetical protein